MTTIVRSTLIVLLVSNNNTELATLHLFLVYCIGSRMDDGFALQHHVCDDCVRCLCDIAAPRP